MFGKGVVLDETKQNGEVYLVVIRGYLAIKGGNRWLKGKRKVLGVYRGVGGTGGLIINIF